MEALSFQTNEFLSSITSNKETPRLGNAFRAIDLLQRLRAFEKEYHYEFGNLDQKNIRLLFEIVVCWGLHGLLLPGVGIPLEKRVKSSVKETGLQQIILEKDPMDPNLFNLCESMFKLVFFPDSHQLLEEDKSYISSILLSKYLGDLFSGLIQLAFCPLPTAHIHSTTSLRDKARSLFMELYENVSSFYTMESLTLLIGSNKREPSPIWLKKICGRFLSRISLRENGVRMTLEFLFSGELPDQIQVIERAAKLILSLPGQASSSIDYYISVGKQSLDILLDRNAKIFHKCASFIISQLLNRDFDAILKNVFQPFFLPFQYLYDESLVPESHQEVILVEGSLFQSRITVITLLFVGNEPNPSLLKVISQILPSLFHMYIFSQESKSYMKQILQTLVYTFFKTADKEIGVVAIEEIIFKPLIRIGNKAILFGAELDGSIALRFREVEESDLDYCSRVSQQLSKFLLDLENEDLNSRLFVTMLDHYAAQNNHPEGVSAEKMLKTADFVMQMVDKLGPKILRNNVEIVQSTLLLLENDDLDVVSTAISVLLAVLSGESINKEIRNTLKESLSIIERLKFHEDKSIKQQAHLLDLLLQTSLISLSEDDELEDLSLKEMQGYLQDLRDDIIPVKVRGMNGLRRMIQRKNCIAEKNFSGILSQYFVLLQEQDSFIYLNAIKCVSALVEHSPSRVLASLLEQYSKVGGLTLDHRLRIGEALLQIIQRHGKFMARFVDLVLPTLMDTLMENTDGNDHHFLMHVSALSIIGCLCEECPFALLQNLRFFISYILDALKLEKQVEVRRASVFIAKCLFQGLKVDSLWTIPPDLLKSLYRQLRWVEDMEIDEISKFHAKVALTELDSIMRKQLFQS